MVLNSMIEPRIGLIPNSSESGSASRSEIIINFESFVGIVVGASSQWMRIVVKKDNNDHVRITLIPFSMDDMPKNILDEMGSLTSFTFRQPYLRGVIGGLKNKESKEVNVDYPYKIANLYCKRVRVSINGINVL